MTYPQVRIRTLVFIAALVTVYTAHAAERNSLELTPGLTYTTNSEKSPRGREDVKKFILGAFNLDYASERARVDARYFGLYQTFERGTQRTYSSVRGVSEVEYDLIPQTLVAQANHERFATQSDSAQGFTSGNLLDNEILRAGLRYSQPLSPVDTLIFSPGYVDIDYDERERIDSKRGTATLSWRHLLSRIDQLQLSSSYQQVDFDERQTDFTYQDISIDYRRRIRNGSTILTIGRSRIDRDDQRQDYGSILGLVFNGSFPVGDVVFSWRQTVTDSSLSGTQGNREQELDGIGELDTGNNATDFDQAELVRREDGLLEFRSNAFACDECSHRLSIDHRDESFELSNRDSYQLNLNYRFNYNYSVHRRWFAQYLERRFDVGDLEFTTQTFGLGWREEITRDLKIRALISYEKRRDNAGGDFHDFRVTTRLNYEIPLNLGTKDRSEIR